MAIDPSIPLDGKPVQIETPLQAQSQLADVATKYQNLRDLAAAEQTQQQQTQALTLENQQRQIELANQQAINQAVSQNVKTDPQTGKAYIDHQAVVGALTAAGKGVAAMNYQQQANALNKTVLDLQQAQEKVNNDRIQHMGSLAGAVLNQTDPQARATAYGLAKSFAEANGYAKPGELPPQYSPALDAQLGSMRDRALTADQQYAAKWNEAKVGAAEDRARAAEQRAATADQIAQQKGQGEWKPNGTRGGQAVYFNPATGQERLGGPQDMQDPGGSAGRRVTADAALADTRSNEKDYETNASAEINARQQRDALDAALRNGKVYVDTKGKIVPFSSMKQADDIAAYTQEMQQRRQVAETSIEQAVSNKNNAMQRNGVRPQVSTADAIASYRGQQTTPPAATTQPAAAAPVGGAGAGQPTAAQPAAAAKPNTPDIRTAAGSSTGQRIAALDDVKRYAQQYFGGDVKKAATALNSQGYQIRGSAQELQALGFKVKAAQ